MVPFPSASVVSCRVLRSVLPGPTATRMSLLTSTGFEPPLAIPNTVTVMSAQTGDEAAVRTTTDASERKASVNGLSGYMVATLSRRWPAYKPSHDCTNCESTCLAAAPATADTENKGKGGWWPRVELNHRHTDFQLLFKP